MGGLQKSWTARITDKFLWNTQLTSCSYAYLIKYVNQIYRKYAIFLWFTIYYRFPRKNFTKKPFIRKPFNILLEFFTIFFFRHIDKLLHTAHWVIENWITLKKAQFLNILDISELSKWPKIASEYVKNLFWFFGFSATRFCLQVNWFHGVAKKVTLPPSIGFESHLQQKFQICLYTNNRLSSCPAVPFFRF